MFKTISPSLSGSESGRTPTKGWSSGARRPPGVPPRGRHAPRLGPQNPVPPQKSLGDNL